MINIKRRLIRDIFLVLIVPFCSCNHNEIRQTISLNGEWNFVIDSIAADNSGIWPVQGLPPERIQKVSVPHTWNTDKSLARYAGKAWYERNITVTPEQLSKVVRLQFNGVYHDAFIWVNGKKAGEHTGSGYNRFFIDISPFLQRGNNRLTVCVDNSFSRSNIPFMRSYDWANDGGIYRNVYEVITDKYAVRMIHVKAVPDEDGGSANIKVSFVDPEIIQHVKVKMLAFVREENQSTRSTIYSGQLNGRFEDGIFITDLNFDKVNLWHFDKPDLYKLTLKLLVDGQEKDDYSVVFGFRTIKVAGNRYVLNGEPMRLMGVEWMPGSTFERGMAETEQDLENNLTLMKNANCIFTRFHWQQDEYVFDWCDRHGIMIQEEIPYWGIWTLLNDTLLNKGLEHLDEMYEAHSNHPSIISWGLGNELLAHEPLIKSGLNKLYRHIKDLDSSRLATYVTNSLHFEMPSENPSRYDATADFDMMMFNEYYSSWYKKSIEAIPGELDRMAGEYPGKPMTISEWGLCDPPQPGGDERRAREMAQQITIYGSKPYIAGAIYFCLNDYRTQRREDYTSRYPTHDHGVTDGYQHPKKSYETLKEISSPVEVSNIKQEKGKVMLTLKGKTGIPSYILRNYYIATKLEKVPVDELKPGEEKNFEISTHENELGIFRPTGYEVVHLKLK